MIVCGNIWKNINVKLKISNTNLKYIGLIIKKNI